MKRILLGIAAVLCLLPLSGCAAEPPEPAALPEPVDYPALDQGRLDQVMTQVREAMQQADEKKDSKAAGERLGHDAKTLRTAQYKYLDSAPDLPLGTRSVTVSASTTWPRYILAANPSEDEKNVYVFLLTQESATSQFQLTNWVRVLPGQDFPRTPNLDTGIQVIDASGTTYQANPSEVIQDYVSLLNGEKTDFKEKMEQSPVTEALSKEIKSLRDSLEDSGELRVKFKLSEAPQVAFQLPDGSALVMGSIVSHSELEKTGDKVLTMSGPVGKALGNDGLVESKATWEYLIPVAFVVPAADSTEKITLIGAEKALLSAS